MTLVQGAEADYSGPRWEVQGNTAVGSYNDGETPGLIRDTASPLGAGLRGHLLTATRVAVAVAVGEIPLLRCRVAGS